MTESESLLLALKKKIDNEVNLDDIYSEISKSNLSSKEKRFLKSRLMTHHSEKLKEGIKTSNRKMLSLIILSVVIFSGFLILAIAQKTSIPYLLGYILVVIFTIRRIKILGSESFEEPVEKRNKNSVFHKGLFKKF